LNCVEADIQYTNTVRWRHLSVLCQFTLQILWWRDWLWPYCWNMLQDQVKN